jgi:hypothetical protein
MPQELPYGTSFASFGLAGPAVDMLVKSKVSMLFSLGELAESAAPLAKPAPAAGFARPRAPGPISPQDEGSIVAAPKPAPARRSRLWLWLIAVLIALVVGLILWLVTR